MLQRICESRGHCAIPKPKSDYRDSQNFKITALVSVDKLVSMEDASSARLRFTQGGEGKEIKILACFWFKAERTQLCLGILPINTRLKHSYTSSI